MMRAGIWIIVLLMAGWSGYWFVGARAMNASVTGWFEAQGTAAQHSGIGVSGFPNRFDLTVEGLQLTDPARGLVWRAPFLQVFMMTWKPWHLIAAFPPRQTLGLPGQDITLTTTSTQASAVLVPGADLTLDRVTLIAADLQALSSAGWQVTAQAVRLASRADPSLPFAQDIGLSVDGLSVDGAGAGADAVLQAGLPATIDVLRLTATAALTAPLDRHMAETQPRLDRIVVREAALRWGSVAVDGAGEVRADAAGLAEGRLEITLQNGQALVPVAVAMGLILPEVGQTVIGMIGRMEAASGTPGSLRLPLTFQGGRMRFGLLPLGPAPRLR